MFALIFDKYHSVLTVHIEIVPENRNDSLSIIDDINRYKPN